MISVNFSGCGKYLLSIGSDSKYSLQLIDWEAQTTGSQSGRLLCFRPTGARPVFWASFDPFDSRKFITLGYKHVAFWKAKGSHLTCSDYLVPEAEDKPEIFTCSEFLKIPEGGGWTSDVLLGSNKGHLSMVISGKLVRCKEQAHKGPVNCLKYSDCLDSVSLTLTHSRMCWYCFREEKTVSSTCGTPHLDRFSHSRFLTYFWVISRLSESKQLRLTKRVCLL